MPLRKRRAEMGTVERERLERELLQAFKLAAEKYEATVAKSTRLPKVHSEVPLDADGEQAVYSNMQNHEQAVEEYRRALKRFADLVLHGKQPDSPQ